MKRSVLLRMIILGALTFLMAGCVSFTEDELRRLDTDRIVMPVRR